MSGVDGGYFGSIEAARKVGISLRQLYHWVDVLHVVEPVKFKHGIREFRRFSEQDVAVLAKMKEIVDLGYTLHAAVGILKKTREAA